MLQDGGLYPGLRPLEVLRSFAAFYDEPQSPESLLELVGLEDARNTVVRRLSGGQQQRLALALALVGRPKLVFLDEPTAGMDPHARATTWQLVRDLRDAGTTVMLTTHAMDEAEQLCDHVAIVDRGRIVASGTPGELTSQAGVDEVHFSASAGLACSELAVALELAPAAVSELRPGEYRVAAEATPTLVADLAIWLRDHDVRLGDLRAGQRTLEEVFLRVTGAGTE
jgi:ABC-2 type transport system ATP-binding protein